jgi:hypothetical protein
VQKALVISFADFIDLWLTLQATTTSLTWLPISATRVIASDPVHLFGIFDLVRTKSNFALIKFAQPIFIIQLRILRKGLKVDLKDHLHTSITQSQEIEDLVFFGSNLRTPKASRFEMISRISPLEKLISKDCIVPVQSPVGPI